MTEKKQPDGPTHTESRFKISFSHSDEIVVIKSRFGAENITASKIAQPGRIL